MVLIIYLEKTENLISNPLAFRNGKVRKTYILYLFLLVLARFLPEKSERGRDNAGFGINGVRFAVPELF